MSRGTAAGSHRTGWLTSSYSNNGGVCVQVGSTTRPCNSPTPKTHRRPETSSSDMGLSAKQRKPSREDLRN